MTQDTGEHFGIKCGREPFAAKPVGRIGDHHFAWYGYAENDGGQIELLYIEHVNGRTVSQTWQGVTYRSARAASDALTTLHKGMSR